MKQKHYKIPNSHPRYLSLKTREQIVEGIKSGITSMHGLIAQGRGEAFDYLLGEKTYDFAEQAIKSAAALLLLAKNPVTSVNGNAAALVPKGLVELSKAIPAKLEVNIFHASKTREKKIKAHLLKHGAAEVLLPQKPIIKFIQHNRRYASPEGIGKADVVFVPLEDGDRCMALRKMGKNVITIDLNPMSRTAKSASITIVDNIIRAMPLLIKEVKTMKRLNKNRLKDTLDMYNNKSVLKQSLKKIRNI